MKSPVSLSTLPVLVVLAGCGGTPPQPSEPPRFDTVSVTCSPSPVVAGQSAQCSASALDQFGAPFSVSAFTWTSGDESLARVDASGKVATAVLSSGSVAIRAQASSGDTTRGGETALSVSAKPPTVHSTAVTSPETWKAQDNPHLVSGAVSVDASAPLTLEPGAVIRFAPDAELKVVRGGLKAAGTAQTPVVLQAEKGGKGAWKGLVLAAKDMASSLEFVTLSGCGGAQGAGACLVIRDGAAPVLKDVTVRESGSLGVLVATADSAFGPGSTRLSVSNSAVAAVRLDANQAGTLPTGGAFTGNTPNVVELTGASITRTQTWPNPSIPYVVKEELTVGHPTTRATLTVAPGTQVRFSADAGLVVGPESNDVLGGLVLDGSAEAPILLTANADNKPGSWLGVHVYTGPNIGRISHTTIEFAGEISKVHYHQGNGSLNLLRGSPEESTFTVTDLIVQKGSGPGFYVSDGGAFGAGSARLTSRGNATYPIHIRANDVLKIPRDVDFRDNGINALALLGGAVATTQTWPKQDLPYLLTDVISVGFTSPITLTLEPGTEIQAAKGSGILVGYYSNRPGALVAQGTAEAPIRFIPDSASADRGHWMGLHFTRATGSKLDHVLVTHGGLIDETNYPNSYGPGNVNIHVELGDFVTNSTLKSARCAYSIDSDVTTNLSKPALNNTFVDNGGLRCFN